MTVMQHPLSCCRPSPSFPTQHSLAFPHRLRISYQITADRLQGEVEFAYRKDWTQVLTTILWGGRIDDASRRLLVDALLLAADESCPVRIHVFAAAARDLFRHASHVLAARRKGRALPTCFGHRSRSSVFENAIPVPHDGPLHDGLLAAARDLRSVARLRPGVTVEVDPVADDSLRATLSALQGVLGSMGDYLEQVMKPLTLPVSRDAIHALILEIRREANEMAACRPLGDVYVETLAVTESHDNAVDLEVEGWLAS